MIRRARTDADYSLADRLARRCGPHGAALPSAWRRVGAVWLHWSWRTEADVEARAVETFQVWSAFAVAHIDADGVLVLGNVGVLPEARGQGLQRRLIRVRERWGRAQNALRARTYVSADNGASLSNLMRCGWTVVGFRAEPAASGDGWVDLARSLVR
jgi:GNAT superfamily N-acetyltransferase